MLQFRSELQRENNKKLSGNRVGTRPTTCSRAMQSSHAQHSAQYRFTCECVVNLTPGCCVNGRPLASAAIADDYPAYTIYLCPTMAHRSFVNQLLPSSIRQARSPRLYPSTNTTARRSYIYGFLAAVFVSVCTSPIWTVPSRHNRGGSSAPPHLGEWWQGSPTEEGG